MKKTLLMIAILFGTLVLGWKWMGKSNLHLSPPEILGGVVRINDPSGDRLYFITAQWAKRVTRIGSRSSSSHKTTSWLDIDLWAFDAATAQPIFRRRIKRDQVHGDSKALGVDQGVLWARLPELVGIRLSDGRMVADPTKIEARNPGLKGGLPKPPEAGRFLTQEMQPLKFDPAVGLVIRLDDARRVRIDPLTLEATPQVIHDPASSRPAADHAVSSGSRVALTPISNGMEWRAMVRGVAMARPDHAHDWLGLVGDSELPALKEKQVISPQMDFSEPRRHRLHRARIETVEGDFGRQVRFVDPTVLPESPEFLMAGLLTQGPALRDKAVALWRRNPDSVFVLSRDRLGDAGRMQLSRIAGPAGTPVWSTALPLAAMSAWLPGEHHALMLGPDPSAPRSAMAEEGENRVMQVVSIDLESGGVKSFNPDLHRDWPVDNPGGKTP